MSATRQVARSSSIMALGTIASRLTGFVRVTLITAVLGTAAVADVYNVPNTIPNALYILVAGGVLNSVLVPQLVRAMREDPDDGNAYAQRIVTAASVVLVVATVAFVFFAPWILRLYVSDAMLTPENRDVFDSMVLVARFTMPQVFFYGYFVLMGQILNARGRFGPMMFAPVLNNIVAILIFGSFLVVVGTKSDPVFTTREAIWFGLGSTLGVALQALVLVPLVLASGVSLRPRWDLRGVGLGKAARLGAWTIGFVAINQLALLVVVRLSTVGTAESITTGEAAGLSAYENAFLVAMVPHSILTVSIATALLPLMSAHAHAGDLSNVGSELASTMRTCTAVMVPIAALLWACSGLISELLFGYGQGVGQTEAIANVLLVMTPGLIGFTLHYLTLRGFYALEDTKTPFFVQIGVAGTNIVAALALTSWAQSNGRGDLIAVALGAAWSLSYLVGCIISMTVLHRRLKPLRPQRQLLAAGHAAAAAIPGTLLVVALQGVIELPEQPKFVRVLMLFLFGAVLVTLAAVIYLGMARVLRLREPMQLVSILRNRGRATAPAKVAASEQEPSIVTASDLRPTDTDAVPMLDDDSLGGGPATQPHYLPSVFLGTVEAVADSGRPVPSGPALTPPPPARVPAPLSESATTPEPPGGEVRRLANRYRLEDMLGFRPNGATSWYGWDETLDRPLLIQTLPATHPHALAFIASAQFASQTHDPRLLRVLDADVDPEDEPDGPSPDELDMVAYVVREWVTGLSLSDLLKAGPLEPTEAATLIREVAAALATAHANGLAHRCLTPDQIIVAHDGAVRVTGVSTQMAAQQGHLPEPANAADIAADVMGLGQLLYAALTARWPQAGPLTVDTLPPAPQHDGLSVLPHQVRAGVPRELDDIVGRILGPSHVVSPAKHLVSARRNRGDELLTAQAIADALAQVTPGGAGAVLFGGSTHAMVRTAMAAKVPEYVQHSAPPTPPPRGANSRAMGGLFGALVALTLAVGALLFIAQVFTTGSPGPSTTASPTASAAQTPTPTSVALSVLAVLAADDYDPEGDGTENPERAPRAIDGSPDTVWRTQTYFSQLSTQKSGVGLVLDLGRPVSVAELSVTFEGEPTATEIRVAPGVATAVPAGIGGWRRVAAVSTEAGLNVIPLDQPRQTRFVLIWLTELPKVDEGWRGGIVEVEVRG